MTKIRIRSAVRRQVGAPHPAGPTADGTPAAVPARERILDAADRAIARYGYRHMTIEDLARDAGMGKGTVYLSFRTKEEIALACIDRMAARVRARLAEIAAGPGAASQRLERMLVARVLLRFDYARGHSSSLDEILAALRPGLLARRKRQFAAEAQLFARLLAAAEPATYATEQAARPAAFALVWATNALLPYSLSTREMGRRGAVLRRARQIARLVLPGALPRTRAAASPPAAPSSPPRPRRRIAP